MREPALLMPESSSRGLAVQRVVPHYLSEPIASIKVLRMRRLRP